MEWTQGHAFVFLILFEFQFGISLAFVIYSYFPPHVFMFLMPGCYWLLVFSTLCQIKCTTKSLFFHLTVLKKYSFRFFNVLYRFLL